MTAATISTAHAWSMNFMSMHSTVTKQHGKFMIAVYLIMQQMSIIGLHMPFSSGKR